MEQTLKLLSTIEFSHLPDDLQSEVQSLSEKIGADYVFSGSDSLAIIAKWHSLEKNQKKQQKIAKLCRKIISATSSIDFGRQGKARAQPQEQQEAPPVSVMLRKISEAPALGFSAFKFGPSNESARKMVSILNRSIRKKMALEETQQACREAGLPAPDAAFVLNFAHCYWPAFEAEADLRESPKSMVDYLLAEKISGLAEKGYGSFFICLMSDEGKPSGIVNGAIGDVNRILERFSLPKMEKDLTATFIGYVALPPSSQGSGADKMLLYEAEKLVQETGRKTDYFLTQVDKPANMIAELQELKRKPEENKDEIEAMEKRVRAAKILMRLWPGRYNLKCVEGMKSMEIIHKYGVGEEVFRKPEKQPQLELLVRPASGEPQMPAQDLRALVTSLYLYYEVSPTAKIRASDELALERYVDYSLENVKIKDGQVGLSDASVLIKED
ncbi:MAG: hypothetical protein NTX79_08800 [Candidatus Micrarchaeota archaeon]|nr:hypothetical protein [Candidatus Micrarchaeota archaeon]